MNVNEISERLTRDAERVCQHLIPNGRMLKGEWICGDVTGGPGDSLKVHLTGQHAGRWRDWANDSDHGDLIDLWRAVRGICAADAIKQAKDWLGIAPTVYAASERTYKPAPKREDLNDPNPQGKAMRFLVKTRRLDPEIIERFKIQVTDQAIVFPCYSPDSRLVNRSYRTLDAKKKVWQDEGCAPCLFGWHALPEDAYKSRTVLLCEGQIDAMTWAQWGVNALSIPNGSGQTWIGTEWENLAIFANIYISFDMDGAGLANAEKTINRLGRHRCLVVKIPHKDANDCLLAGCTAADAAEWIKAAIPPKLKNMLTARELEGRLLAALQPRKECFTLPFLRVGKTLDGYFPRPGEVTLWTGVTSNGKSTFLNFLMLAILITGTPVFIASMEVKAEVVLRKMMASFMGRPPTPQDVTEFLDHVGHNLIFADVVGYIGQEQLLEMMQFAHSRHGAGHFLVDSLMRIEGLEEDYVQQGNFLNKAQEFVKHADVHLHLVAHPRKMQEDGKPKAMDIKGSSLIPNNADNIVAVCRNAEKDKLRKDNELTPMQNAAMYDAEIRVEKQRETGWEGRFLLKFDPVTFSYSATDPAKTTK